jgi:hypothetical protein
MQEGGIFSVQNRFEHEVQVVGNADREISPSDGLRSLVKFVIAGSISVILFIGFLTALISNWGIYVAASGSLIRLGAQMLVPAAVLAGVGFCIKYGLSTWAYYKNATVDIASKSAENAIRQAEAQRLLAEADRMRNISHLDEQGNLMVRDEFTGRWQLVQGNMREHPALHSMHYSIKSESNNEPIALPAAGQTAKPKVEDLAKLVERNSFQVPLGNSLRGNGPVIIDIESSHIRVIGTSQFGKSCLAAAVLDLVTQTHDSDVMLIALLDMENKTSKLFEDNGNLAVLQLGSRKIPLHARNPRQAAEYLHLIRNEMDRRYSLPEAEQEKQPHILVYIEEFLSLKKHKDLDNRTKATLFDDLNEIAIRGLKVFIHLMACAQVDYADDDLKPLNNNFGVNVSFTVRPEAARAAGFGCSELLAMNWQNKQKGQCVVEATGCTDLVESPDYNVKALLKARNEPAKVVVSEVSETLPKQDRNEQRNMPQEALQAKLYQVMENPGENMRDCIRRVWGATPGDNEGWKLAKGEYEEVLKTIHQLARKGMEA